MRDGKNHIRLVAGIEQQRPTVLCSDLVILVHVPCIHIYIYIYILILSHIYTYLNRKKVCAC